MQSHSLRGGITRGSTFGVHSAGSAFVVWNAERDSLEKGEQRKRKSDEQSGHELMKRCTVDLLKTMKKCNSKFNFDEDKVPKRLLTFPGEGVLNNNYDNEHSDYILRVRDVITNSTKKTDYMIEDILGKGTFGQVVKCSVGKQQYAVKVIKNRQAYFQQAKTEILLLRVLNKCENEGSTNEQQRVVQLIDFFVFRNHFCLVFELLDQSLFDFLKGTAFTGFPLPLIAKWTKAIVHGMMVAESKQIIHCDLKPENIMLKNNEVKIIDFGSACLQENRIYTYIQSRFYRAPEVILGMKYTIAIDMWSLGCIIAELFLGIPLFPGNSEYDQLSRIVSIRGEPSKESIQDGRFWKKFFHEKDSKVVLKNRQEFEFAENVILEDSKRYYPLTCLGDLKKYYYNSPFRQIYSDEKKVESQIEMLLDLLEKLLQIDPMNRISASSALRHPFLSDGMMQAAEALPEIQELLKLKFNQPNMQHFSEKSAGQAADDATKRTQDITEISKEQYSDKKAKQQDSLMGINNRNQDEMNKNTQKQQQQKQEQAQQQLIQLQSIPQQVQSEQSQYQAFHGSTEQHEQPKSMQVYQQQQQQQQQYQQLYEQQQSYHSYSQFQGQQQQQQQIQPKPFQLFQDTRMNEQLQQQQQQQQYQSITGAPLEGYALSQQQQQQQQQQYFQQQQNTYYHYYSQFISQQQQQQQQQHQQYLGSQSHSAWSQLPAQLPQGLAASFPYQPMGYFQSQQFPENQLINPQIPQFPPGMMSSFIQSSEQLGNANNYGMYSQMKEKQYNQQQFQSSQQQMQWILQQQQQQQQLQQQQNQLLQQQKFQQNYSSEFFPAFGAASQKQQQQQQFLPNFQQQQLQYPPQPYQDFSLPSNQIQHSFTANPSVISKPSTSQAATFQRSQTDKLPAAGNAAFSAFSDAPKVERGLSELLKELDNHGSKQDQFEEPKGEQLQRHQSDALGESEEDEYASQEQMFNAFGASLYGYDINQGQQQQFPQQGSHQLPSQGKISKSNSISNDNNNSNINPTAGAAILNLNNNSQSNESTLLPKNPKKSRNKKKNNNNSNKHTSNATLDANSSESVPQNLQFQQPRQQQGGSKKTAFQSQKQQPYFIEQQQYQQEQQRSSNNQKQKEPLIVLAKGNSGVMHNKQQNTQSKPAFIPNQKQGKNAGNQMNLQSSRLEQQQHVYVPKAQLSNKDKNTNKHTNSGNYKDKDNRSMNNRNNSNNNTLSAGNLGNQRNKDTSSKSSNRSSSSSSSRRSSGVVDSSDSCSRDSFARSKISSDSNSQSGDTQSSKFTQYQQPVRQQSNFKSEETTQLAANSNINTTVTAPTSFQKENNINSEKMSLNGGNASNQTEIYELVNGSNINSIPESTFNGQIPQKKGKKHMKERWVKKGGVSQQGQISEATKDIPRPSNSKVQTEILPFTGSSHIS